MTAENDFPAQARDRRCDILGVSIDRFDMDATVAAARDLIASGGCHHHMGVNAVKIVEAHEDARTARLFNDAAIVNPDGQSVVWASRLLGDPLPARVTGIDFMDRLVEMSAEEGHTIYLLGATADVVEEAARRFALRGAAIVGHHDGFWRKSMTDAQMAEIIADHRPDILLVGVPSPMKEEFITDQMHRMGVPLSVGVGGSFDVAAGVLRRAPVPMQKLGLEWFYRFLQEPRRMFRRYFVGNSKFIYYVLRQRLGRAHT